MIDSLRVMYHLCCLCCCTALLEFVILTGIFNTSGDFTYLIVIVCVSVSLFHLFNNYRHNNRMVLGRIDMATQ